MDLHTQLQVYLSGQHLSTNKHFSVHDSFNTGYFLPNSLKSEEKQAFNLFRKIFQNNLDDHDSKRDALIMVRCLKTVIIVVLSQIICLSPSI